MKTFRHYVLLTLALLLLASTQFQAQHEDNTLIYSKDRVILIEKNNEEERVVKNFDDLDNILIDFNVNEEDAKKVEDFMYDRAARHSTKPYLGVYSSKNRNGNGIVIDRTVNNSAADKAGIQAGDIVTAMNGNTINSVSDLRSELKNHKAGDAVTIQYVRNGQANQMQVTLGAKKIRNHHYSYRTHSKVKRDPCKVFIGVYSGTSYNEKGVRVTGVIKNTPAYEVDLLKGDYITAIDGIEVHSHRELLKERNKHNPGDKFLVNYTRDGIAYETMAQFKSCPTNEEKTTPIVEEKITEVAPVEEKPFITQPTNNTLKVEGMEAYPNPTYGDLNLRFKAEAKPIAVRIVDIQGRVIFNETLNNFDGDYNRQLDLSDGTPGVLSITISQQGKAFTKNIVLLARA